MTSKSSFGSFSFCCEGDEELATRSPRELPAVPAEGTTKGGRTSPRPRARLHFIGRSDIDTVIITFLFRVTPLKFSPAWGENLRRTSSSIEVILLNSFHSFHRIHVKLVISDMETDGFKISKILHKIRI